MTRTEQDRCWARGPDSWGHLDPPNLGHGLTWACSPGSWVCRFPLLPGHVQVLHILHKLHHLSQGDGQAQSRGLEQATCHESTAVFSASPGWASSCLLIPTHLCSLSHTLWPQKLCPAFLAQMGTNHSKSFLRKPKQTNTQSLCLDGSNQQGPLGHGPWVGVSLARV